MANKYTVAICDDEEANRQGWEEALVKIVGFKEQFNVRPIVAEDDAESSAEFHEAIISLGERRKRARSNTKTTEFEPNLFDNIDLLIVDYDLIDAEHGHWITGEEIAYLARCYSRCKVIVSVNQFGPNPFDLNLTGHFSESFADLNLGDVQVANSGLWCDCEAEGFRPWYWPLLPKLIKDMEWRVQYLIDKVDLAVKEVLGFRDEAWHLLPRETIAWITPRGNAEPSDRFTVREVVERSPLGIHPKDKLLNDEAVARVAAARLGQWLDNAVLAAQDILIDAPHLVERYASLTGVKTPTITQLNKFARIASPTVLNLDERLTAMAFQEARWLSRPAWYWPEVARADWIEEVCNPWGRSIPDAFFCEDVSRFAPMNQTREFRIRVPSVYDARRCIDPEAGDAKALKSALSGVDYQPNGRLMD